MFVLLFIVALCILGEIVQTRLFAYVWVEVNPRLPSDATHSHVYSEDVSWDTVTNASRWWRGCRCSQHPGQVRIVYKWNGAVCISVCNSVRLQTYTHAPADTHACVHGLFFHISCHVLFSTIKTNHIHCHVASQYRDSLHHYGSITPHEYVITWKPFRHY